VRYVHGLQFFRGANTGNRSVLANDPRFTGHKDVDFKLTGWTGAALAYNRLSPLPPPRGPPPPGGGGGGGGARSGDPRWT